MKALIYNIDIILDKIKILLIMLHIGRVDSEQFAGLFALLIIISLANHKVIFGGPLCTLHLPAVLFVVRN